ncbi:MAG: hypothetical protein KGI50_08225, partial [Patescibacteria group bacterium]|nr:hypothetical protein [Patescibacteria group bacterium]
MNELKVGEVIQNLRDISDSIEKCHGLNHHDQSDIEMAIKHIQKQAAELEAAKKDISNLQTKLGWARSNVEDSQKQI